MGFVKLDSGFLDSTLWEDKVAREVFLTALLMALPYEVTDPTPALAVRSLDGTGFTVSPGWYGMVESSGIGLVRRSLADRDEGMDALERLGAPDPESRSTAFDGRRLVRVESGLIVLNFIRYRDRDYTAAVRSQRYRDRKKELAAREDVTSSPRVVTASHRVVTPSRRVVTPSHPNVTAGPSSSRGGARPRPRVAVSAPPEPPLRRFRPAPRAFRRTRGTVLRPGSHAGGRPTTCRGSGGCWATDAAATRARPALVSRRAGSLPTTTLPTGVA